MKRAGRSIKMTSNILEAENICKSYHKKDLEIPAVRSLSLTLGEGRIICLFGRSGSGKTTLLNLLGCLDSIDSGSITISGKNIADIPQSRLPEFRRKHLGFVFQHFNLIPYLTALENVALPMKYEGIPRKKREEMAGAMLEKVGMKERVDFRMSELSGGQIQRIAFARAVINNPKIVLADEPTGQLDTSSAGELAEIIRELNRETGIAFIIATHDSIISSLASRIYKMEDGRLTGG